MGLEDIVNKILAEAKKNAEAILTQARQEAEQIQKEAEEKARDLAQEIIQASQTQAHQEALRVVSLARLEAKKITLLAKQKLLNQVFADQRVLNLAKSKKEIVLPDHKRHEELDPKIYLELLRRDYESRVIQVLLGENEK